MRKIFILLSLLFVTLAFSYEDSDFDGVEDALDKCPNTPFTDLVDINGCTKKSLVSPHNFDIIVGASYSDSDYQTLNATDTLSTTLQVDYYYKNLSVQASTSYFSTSGSGYSESGLNDSFIGASYQLKPTNALYVRVGGGLLLPTYKSALNNNKMDYIASLNLSYTVSNFSFFGGYSYTFVNDTNAILLDDANNTIAVDYQNTTALSGGIGYYINDKLYMSGAYNVSNSIYDGVEDIQTASLYGYYGIDKNWFTTFSYARGLSESATKNYVSIRLGYFF